MSYQTQGRSLVGNFVGWIIALMLGVIMLRILMAELVRWLTIMAPWILLSSLIAAVAALVIVLIPTALV